MAVKGGWRLDVEIGETKGVFLFLWFQILKDGKFSHFVDGQNEACSNWKFATRDFDKITDESEIAQPRQFSN